MKDCSHRSLHSGVVTEATSVCDAGRKERNGRLQVHAMGGVARLGARHTAHQAHVGGRRACEGVATRAHPHTTGGAFSYWILFPAPTFLEVRRTQCVLLHLDISGQPTPPLPHGAHTSLQMPLPAIGISRFLLKDKYIICMFYNIFRRLRAEIRHNREVLEIEKLQYPSK